MKKILILVVATVALFSGVTLVGRMSQRHERSAAETKRASAAPSSDAPAFRERPRLADHAREAPDTAPRPASPDNEREAEAGASAVSAGMAGDGASSAFAAPVSPDARRELVRDRQRRLAEHLDERMRSEPHAPDLEQSMSDRVLAAHHLLPFLSDVGWEAVRCTENLCRALVSFPSSDVQAQKEGFLRAIPHFTGGEVFVYRANDTDEPTSIVYFTPEGKEIPWAFPGSRG